MFTFGLIVSWVYLRFYQVHPNGSRGDNAESFGFARYNFFVIISIFSPSLNHFILDICYLRIDSLSIYLPLNIICKLSQISFKFCKDDFELYYNRRTGTSTFDITTFQVENWIEIQSRFERVSQSKARPSTFTKLNIFLCSPLEYIT